MAAETEARVGTVEGRKQYTLLADKDEVQLLAAIIRQQYDFDYENVEIEQEELDQREITYNNFLTCLGLTPVVYIRLATEIELGKMAQDG